MHLVGAHRAHAQRARHVRPVAVDHGPEVDHDELARLDAAIGRPGVRERAVGAARDDGVEGDRVSPATAHLELERERELLLGGRFAQELFDLRESHIGDIGRAARSARPRPPP